MRLISVIMNESDSKIRNSETSELLDYGFNLYKVNNLVKKNQVVTKYIDNKSVKLNNDVIVKNDIKILNKKNSKKRNITYEIILDNKNLPIKKNEKIGVIKVKENGKIIYSDNVYSKELIKKANIFEILFRNIKDLLNGKYIFN